MAKEWEGHVSAMVSRFAGRDVLSQRTRNHPCVYCCTTWILFFFCKLTKSLAKALIMAHQRAGHEET